MKINYSYYCAPRCRNTGEYLYDRCITEDMQATTAPSETLVKVKVSTTINCILLQSPDTRYHPFSFCLILQIQLLIRWKTTNQLSTQSSNLCFSHIHYQVKLMVFTDQIEFWMGTTAGKLNCTQEQPVYTHHACFPLLFHGKKPSNTHKFSLTKISFKVPLRHTNGCFLQIQLWSTTKTLLKYHFPFILTQKSRCSGRA